MTIAPRSSGKSTDTTAHAAAPDEGADLGQRSRRPWYRRRVSYVASLVAIAVVVAGLVALKVRDSETTSSGSGGGRTAVPTNPYDAAFGSFDPITTSGRGRGTIPLPAGARAGIVTAAYQGSGFFDVGFTRGKGAFPLINWSGVRGAYYGSVPFGINQKPQANALTVWASGRAPWQVTIAPVSSAKELPRVVTGTGDAVFRYSGKPTGWVFHRTPGSHRLLIAQAASPSRFRTRVWTVDGSSTTLRLGSGPSLVAVSTDGRWSATAKPPAPGHMARVRLQGIRGAKGSWMAGVVVPGTPPLVNLRITGVGGFRVKVDGDPFSQVISITTRDPILHLRAMPGPLADLSPGPYFLMLWRGPSLGPYGAWVPAQEPGLKVCLARFDVRHNKVTTVTVTGFPKHARPGDFKKIGTCRP